MRVLRLAWGENDGLRVRRGICSMVMSCALSGIVRTNLTQPPTPAKAHPALKATSSNFSLSELSQNSLTSACNRFANTLLWKSTPMYLFLRRRLSLFSFGVYWTLPEAQQEFLMNGLWTFCEHSWNDLQHKWKSVGKEWTDFLKKNEFVISFNKHINLHSN